MLNHSVHLLVNNNNTLDDSPVNKNPNKSLGYSLSYIYVARRILKYLEWFPAAYPTRAKIADGKVSVNTVGNAIAQFKADGLFLINHNGIKRPSTYSIGPLIQSPEHQSYLLEILPEMNLYLQKTLTFHSGIVLNSNIQSQVKFPSIAFDCRLLYSKSEMYERALLSAITVPMAVPRCLEKREK